MEKKSIKKIAKQCKFDIDEDNFNAIELENHAVKKPKKLIKICITCKKSKELVTGMKNYC